MTAVVNSLARVDALSNKAVSDIMDGLAKGSVTKFAEVFKSDITFYSSQQASTTYTGGSQTALMLSSSRLQKPPTSTIPYLQEPTGISQVAVSIVAGTVMVFMVSTNVRNPMTNLELQ